VRLRDGLGWKSGDWQVRLELERAASWTVRQCARSEQKLARKKQFDGAQKLKTPEKSVAVQIVLKHKLRSLKPQLADSPRAACTHCTVSGVRSDCIPCL
jgi:hypothetical protein